MHNPTPPPSSPATGSPSRSTAPPEGATPQQSSPTRTAWSGGSSTASTTRIGNTCEHAKEGTKNYQKRPFTSSPQPQEMIPPRSPHSRSPRPTYALSSADRQGPTSTASLKEQQPGNSQPH